MRSARGFTLIEVLVALVLFALFAVVAYRALDAVLTAERHATAEMGRWHDLATTFALMESDLSNVVTGFNPQDPVGSAFHSLEEPDGAAQFDAVRLLPEDADQGLQRIGYRCAGGTLVRLVWPDVNDPARPPSESALLKGLRECAFRFADSRGQWLTGWHPKVNEPPRLVEIRIRVADGTPIRRALRVR